MKKSMAYSKRQNSKVGLADRERNSGKENGMGNSVSWTQSLHIWRINCQGMLLSKGKKKSRKRLRTPRNNCIHRTKQQVGHSEPSPVTSEPVEG